MTWDCEEEGSSVPDVEALGGWLLWTVCPLDAVVLALKVLLRKLRPLELDAEEAVALGSCCLGSCGPCKLWPLEGIA